jgi:hypothetical protein
MVPFGFWDKNDQVPNKSLKEKLYVVNLATVINQ